MMLDKQPTTRFTNTVEHYQKHRPSYPDAVLKLLAQYVVPTSHTACADIGSGTGILSELLLATGYTVYGIEPNTAMRQAAGNKLAAYKNFHSIAGSAEQTHLPNQSIALITAAQAFHWFDINNTKTEFKRILQPQGKVALIWNLRDKQASNFMQAYENLWLKYGENYQKVAAEYFPFESLNKFFATDTMQVSFFPSSQQYDLEGLKGRILSASYCPKKDTKNFDLLMQAGAKLFAEEQQQGQITMHYQTVIYLGQL
jgi:ubiquinone/menaquinone biosynthesis C-methylase UbiE